MLFIAIVLVAAQVYVDPYADEKLLRDEEPRTAPPPPTLFEGSKYSQVGFTGNLGVVVPLPQQGEVGLHGGVGVRYGMRPPQADHEVYFTPAISFLVAGQFLTAIRQSYPQSNPLGSQLSAPASHTFGDVGVDVRLELTVSRHGGVLMPDFATWLTTGTAVGFDGERVFPTAHVGFGLGINFVREVAPALANAMFSGEAWGNFFSGGGGGFSLGGLGGGGGGGVLILLAAIVILPVAIVGGMVAFFLGSSLASMANLELRYTMLPTDQGISGYGGLVIGFGV